MERSAGVGPSLQPQPTPGPEAVKKLNFSPAHSGMKTGVQSVCNAPKTQDSAFRRNDVKRNRIDFFTPSKGESMGVSLSKGITLKIVPKYCSLPAVGEDKGEGQVCRGIRKRKGVPFPCCRATVMETKADDATAQAGRPASRLS